MLRYELTGRRKTSGEYPLPVTAIQTLEDDALAKAGRHAAITNASLYYMGCLQQWHISGVHKVRLWRDNKVSEWQSIYISVQQCPPNIDPLSQTDKSLAALATWYVKEELKIIPTHNEFRRSLKVACESQVSKSSCEEELRSILQALPAGLVGKANKFLRLSLDKAYQDALNSLGTSNIRAAPSSPVSNVVSSIVSNTDKDAQALNQKVTEPVTTATTPACAGTVPVTTDAVVQADAATLTPNSATPAPIDMDRHKKERCKRKREQREGENPGNYEIEKKAITACSDRRELYRLCSTAATTLSTKKVTESSRAWLNRIKRTTKKIDLCVQDHHGGKLESFLAMSGTFSPSTYKCKCFLVLNKDVVSQTR